MLLDEDRISGIPIWSRRNMARPKKLTPAAVRRIFKSTGSAPTIAKQFGVSANLVYLIRTGRIHKKATVAMAAPARPRERQRATGGSANIDVKALADAIIDRLSARLFSRGRR
jgi:hypothetical protein